MIQFEEIKLTFESPSRIQEKFTFHYVPVETKRFF